uniref:hypothetical protein n=1 Tax=Acaryochloris sp. IP29b_bin.148 TaxID=2969218 RepID=UPI00262325A5
KLLIREFGNWAEVNGIGSHDIIPITKSHIHLLLENQCLQLYYSYHQHFASMLLLTFSASPNYSDALILRIIRAVVGSCKLNIGRFWRFWAIFLGFRSVRF